MSILKTSYVLKTNVYSTKFICVIVKLHIIYILQRYIKAGVPIPRIVMEMMNVNGSTYMITIIQIVIQIHMMVMFYVFM